MNRKGLAILVLAAVILLVLFSPARANFGTGSVSSTVQGANLGNTLPELSAARAVQSAGTSEGTTVIQGSGDVSYAPYMGGADFGGSTVSSASLIPKEVVGTEDFGQFSPDKILGNQNYLDPRSQIGYPETIGGVLRNANRDFRSEPLNPRTPVSIFNLSTIPPDVMRPRFEIDREYQ
jgi:hypothetical protein